MARRSPPQSFPQRGYSADSAAGYVEYVEGDTRFLEVKPGRFDDRTDEQLARFGRGLKSLNKVYAHPKVTTLRLDTPVPDSVLNTLPYDQRGCESTSSRTHLSMALRPIVRSNRGWPAGASSSRSSAAW